MSCDVYSIGHHTFNLGTRIHQHLKWCHPEVKLSSMKEKVPNILMRFYFSKHKNVSKESIEAHNELTYFFQFQTTIPDIKKCTFLTRESTWASRYKRYLTLPHVT